MKIGILGSGRIGAGLGAMWARVGHRVVLGACPDRPRSAPALPIDVAFEAACPDGLGDADVVLLAARLQDLAGYLRATGPMAGRTVIVPHRADDAAPDGRPLATWLHERLPEARLVYAFENVGWSFGGAEGALGPAEIPVRAPNAEARSLVAALVEDLALVPRAAERQGRWPTVYLAAVTA